MVLNSPCGPGWPRAQRPPPAPGFRTLSLVLKGIAVSALLAADGSVYLRPSAEQTLQEERDKETTD